MKIKAARLVAAKKVTRSTQERLPPVSRGPLLVIDGDSFAHRSYHALPKTILRRGRKQAGAIVGFANMLLRLRRVEVPRAVLVAWDTLEVPTYRHEEFYEYQSAREFEDALVEQLPVLPEFVAACGFQNAKAPGFEADDFWPPLPPLKRSDIAKLLLPAATAIPFSSLPNASRSFSVLQRCANAME